jgi:YD repeat-containing protein
MADLIGIPVATQIKPFPQTSLADMLGIARTAQELKQAQIMNPLQAQQAKELVAQSQIGTKKAEMGLSEDKIKKIAGSQVSMINNPLVIAAERDPGSVDPQKLRDLVVRNGMETAKSMGIPEDQAMQLLQPYVERAMSSPGGLRQYYKERHIQGLDEAARTALFQPSGQQIQTGARGYTVQTGEFGPYQPGQIIPGTTYTTEIGAGSRVQPTGRTDPQGNPTAYVYGPDGRLIGEQVIPAGVGGPGIGAGAQPPMVPPMPTRRETPDLNAPIETGGAVPAGPMPPPPGAPTRLTAGESGMLTEQIKMAQDDWMRTQAENREAQTRISTFQKIKSLVPEAFTGVGGEQKQFLSGVAQAIGVPLNVLETSTTEELAKNTRLLQLAGGNTDAARAIAELANPSAKMTKEGILRVTNQMIGMEKMKQARANYLKPFARDAEQYVQQMNAFDSLADPRMFQEATPADVKKMKEAMSPAEQAEFLNKVRQARQMGIL